MWHTHITAQGPKQLFVTSESKNKERMKAVMVACAVQGYLQNVLKGLTFKKLKSSDIREGLLRLEKSFISPNYKFGVLYSKKGQDENQMFSNGNYAGILC